MFSTKLDNKQWTGEEFNNLKIELINSFFSLKIIKHSQVI